MLYLIATLDPAEDLPPLTPDSFVALVSSPPQDLLQLFLVRHARCVVRNRQAITLTPDCVLDGWLHLDAECQVCRVTEIVSTALNASAAKALHWWRFLAASIIGSQPDTFLTAKTSRPSKAFWRSLLALQDTIGLGVLRYESDDDTPTIH